MVADKVIAKIPPKVDPKLIYDGQIVDRVTEPEFETKNAMMVKNFTYRNVVSLV